MNELEALNDWLEAENAALKKAIREVIRNLSSFGNLSAANIKLNAGFAVSILKEAIGEKD